MLTIAGCRARQHRLREVLKRNRWDCFITANYRTVYYLTGSLSPAETPVIFLMPVDGPSTLVTSAKAEAAADAIVHLETYSISRSISYPARDAAVLLKHTLAGKRKWTAIASESASVSGSIMEAVPVDEWADATAVILQLRKRKEPDEIDEIRASLRLCAVAYTAAKQTIAAGLTELDVFNAMSAAVVREAGTSVALPGDFACGARGIRGGGPPTRRRIQAGDLYILDLFPAPALYFGDTCRTFSVGSPTDLQFRAWEIVSEAVGIGEAMVRPGVRAKDVYTAIKEFLDSHEITGKSFWHHAGHGIGHDGHEAPRIIPGSDEVFEEGDVFTLEPGVYTEALQGGIRLEDNYLVREHGIENLFDYPRELQ